MAIKQVLDGDASGAIKAIDDLNARMKALLTHMGSNTKESQKLEYALKRVTRENETDLEKYNRKMEELDRLFKTGRLSTDLATRAAQKYQNELDGVKQSGDGAFGSGAVAQIRDYVTGLFGIGQALSAITQAFQEAEQSAQQSVERMISSLGAVGELQQLATGSTEEERARSFTRLLGEQRSLIARGVFAPGQEAEAADFIFALGSQGVGEEDRRKIIQAIGDKFLRRESAVPFVEGAAKVQGLFGAEAGSVGDVINRIVQAQIPTASSAGEFAKAATEYADAGRALGLGINQIFAAGALTELKSPNIDVAATRLRSFFDQISKRGLGGGDLFDILNRVQSQVTEAGGDPFAVLGETRAVQGFRALRENLPRLRDLQEQIAAAPALDVITAQSGLIFQDPELRAGITQERARGRRAEAERQRNEVEALFNALREDTLSRRLDQGQVISGYLADFFLRSQSTLGLERGYLQREIVTDPFITEASPDTRENIVDYLRRTAEGIEKLQLDAAVPKPVPSGRQE